MKNQKKKMTITKIPGTSRTIFLNNHIGDTVINLQNYPEISDSIKNEDVMIIGNWEDYSGEGTISSNEVMLQGVSIKDPDSLLGQMERTKINITNRGNRGSSKRQRPRLVTI